VRLTLGGMLGWLDGGKLVDGRAFGSLVGDIDLDGESVGVVVGSKLKLGVLLSLELGEFEVESDGFWLSNSEGIALCCELGIILGLIIDRLGWFDGFMVVKGSTRTNSPSTVDEKYATLSLCVCRLCASPSEIKSSSKAIEIVLELMLGDPAKIAQAPCPPLIVAGDTIVTCGALEKFVLYVCM
jgi:hypothetical protein